MKKLSTILAVILLTFIVSQLNAQVTKKEKAAVLSKQINDLVNERMHFVFKGKTSGWSFETP